MIDRAHALKELLGKVEEGSIDPVHSTRAFKALGFTSMSRAAAAYYGSLDSARALHEAVLPRGWTRSVDATVPEDGIAVTLHPVDSRGFAAPYPLVHGDHVNEARAWLIAILKALIAEEGE